MLPFVPGSGIRVLGVPVEHPAEDGSFTKALFGKAVTKLETMCSTLTRLPAAHVQYTLLRYCLDSCRLNFLTRCSSARHIPTLVERADNILRQTLGDVLGTPLTDKQWAQARLPQRHGGLGIGSPVDRATPGDLPPLWTMPFGHRRRCFCSLSSPWCPRTSWKWRVACSKVWVLNLPR